MSPSRGSLPVHRLTVFLDLPAATHAAGTAFWCAVTSSRLSPARGESGEFATLLPPSGTPWLRVQRLADGPARTHLDVHVDVTELTLDDAADLTRNLGARELRREDDVVVLTSPGGYVFCLVEGDGEAEPPAPVEFGGSASRADQLCLDIPPESYETECAFWAALTGWVTDPGSLPAFRSLRRPPGQPVRILLQRRDVAVAGDPVTSHLDLACDDRDALTAPHVQAGATVLARHEFWTTLLDPAGLPYCLTPRDPRTGLRPA